MDTVLDATMHEEIVVVKPFILFRTRYKPGRTTSKTALKARRFFKS